MKYSSRIINFAVFFWHRTLGPPLRPSRSVGPKIVLLLPRDILDQRHHRLVPDPQRRRFPSVRDRRVVDHDRAGATVEAEAERRENPRERRHVIIWYQQLPEARMRRERHGGADGAWRVREVDVAPLAEMPQVKEENDARRQQADHGESMCREGSARAKLTDRSRRNEEGNVLDDEARYQSVENCIYGRIGWQEVV